MPRTLLERRHGREPVRPEEAFGAVVEGLDLADPTAAEQEEIAGLLKRHRLLVFRHQSLTLSGNPMWSRHFLMEPRFCSTPPTRPRRCP